MNGIPFPSNLFLSKEKKVYAQQHYIIKDWEKRDWYILQIFKCLGNIEIFQSERNFRLVEDDLFKIKIIKDSSKIIITIVVVITLNNFIEVKIFVKICF